MGHPRHQHPQGGEFIRLNQLFLLEQRFPLRLFAAGDLHPRQQYQVAVFGKQKAFRKEDGPRILPGIADVEVVRPGVGLGKRRGQEFLESPVVPGLHELLQIHSHHLCFGKPQGPGKGGIHIYDHTGPVQDHPDPDALFVELPVSFFGPDQVVA